MRDVAVYKSIVTDGRENWHKNIVMDGGENCNKSIVTDGRENWHKNIVMDGGENCNKSIVKDCEKIGSRTWRWMAEKIGTRTS